MSYNDRKEETNSYYDMLKKENYRALLDSQIQLDNARQRAGKQMNVGLAASGMNSSGYAGMQQQNLNNQYLQGLQNSQQAYLQQQQNLDQQQNSAIADLNEKEQNTNAQSIYNIFESGGYENLNQLYDALTKGNYGTFDGTNFKWNENLNLSEQDKNNLNAQLSLLGNQFDLDSESSEDTSNIYTGNNDDKVLFYYKKNGELLSNAKVKDVFEKETATLNASVASGSIPKDSYVVLHNGYDDYLYLYIDKQGAYHYVNKDQAKQVGADNLYVIDSYNHVYHNDTNHKSVYWVGF